MLSSLLQDHPLARASRILTSERLFKLGEMYEADQDESSAKSSSEDAIYETYCNLSAGHQVCGLSFQTECFPFVTKDTTDVTQLNPSLLQKSCTPSPFGDLKHGDTKIDSKIRDAWETKDIVLTPQGKEWVSQITQNASSLFGNRKIKAEFDKLNLYRTGGFFKVHQDTPRINRVGTLLVFLPTEFTGGEFQITIPGASLPYQDCFAQSWAARQKGKITALVFFGECPHQVTPVKSGHRITLSFHLVVDHECQVGMTEIHRPTESQLLTYSKVKSMGSKPETTPSLQSDPKLGRKLQRDVETYLATSRQIGFLLTHKYSYDEHKNTLLKGNDVILSQLFPPSKFETLVTPIIIFSHMEYPVDDNPRLESNMVYRMTEEDWHRLMLGGATGSRPSSILFFPAPGDDRIVLRSESVSMAEFTGNEARDGFEKNWYLSAAYIIKSKKPITSQ